MTQKADVKGGNAKLAKAVWVQNFQQKTDLFLVRPEQICILNYGINVYV